METVLIVIHLMVVVALVAVVLLQRSEGGALGIGGGGGGGGFMSARGAADTLTRTTSILAAAFFVTSISLGLIGRYGENPTDILDRVPVEAQQEQGGEGAGSGGILDQLGGADALNTGDEAPGDASGEGQPAQPAIPTD